MRAHGMDNTNIVLVDQPTVYHKVSGDSVSNRSSGAWGKGGKAVPAGIWDSTDSKQAPYRTLCQPGKTSSRNSRSN